MADGGGGWGEGVSKIHFLFNIWNHLVVKKGNLEKEKIYLKVDWVTGVSRCV